MLLLYDREAEREWLVTCQLSQCNLGGHLDALYLNHLSDFCGAFKQWPKTICGSFRFVGLLGNGPRQPKWVDHTNGLLSLSDTG